MGCSPSKEDINTDDQRNLSKLQAWEQKEKDYLRFTVENEVKYDPWGGFDDREVSERTPVEEEKEILVRNCEIVDLRTNSGAIKKAREVKSAVKHSEAQTDSTEGVDFDWDLTDKTDIETQVNILTLCIKHERCFLDCPIVKKWAHR